MAFTQLGSIPNPIFSRPPVESTPNRPNEMLSGISTTETANNMLNTFQDVDVSKGNTESVDKQTNKLGEAIANATKSNDSGSDNNQSEGNSSVALSDARCKELFGSTDLLDSIAELNEYVYKYKESAKNNPKLDGKGADDGTFVGPVAQDLAQNPVTKDCVHKDEESGYLTVDTKHLSLTEMSLISMLAKRLEELEKAVYTNSKEK